MQGCSGGHIPVVSSVCERSMAIGCLAYVQQHYRCMYASCSCVGVFHVWYQTSTESFHGGKAAIRPGRVMNYGYVKPTNTSLTPCGTENNTVTMACQQLSTNSPAQGPVVLSETAAQADKLSQGLPLPPASVLHPPHPTNQQPIWFRRSGVRLGKRGCHRGRLRRVRRALQLGADAAQLGAVTAHAQ